MPLNITPPIEKEFTLDKSDKALGNTGDPTTVKISRPGKERTSRDWICGRNSNGPGKSKAMSPSRRRSLLRLCVARKFF